jgi:hypothetical protein
MLLGGWGGWWIAESTAHDAHGHRPHWPHWPFFVEKLAMSRRAPSAATGASQAPPEEKMRERVNLTRVLSRES